MLTEPSYCGHSEINCFHNQSCYHDGPYLGDTSQNKPLVLVGISIASIKCPDLYQHGEERVYFPYTSMSRSIIKGKEARSEGRDLRHKSGDKN